jgi:hypothetical protein
MPIEGLEIEVDEPEVCEMPQGPASLDFGRVPEIADHGKRHRDVLGENGQLGATRLFHRRQPS